MMRALHPACFGNLADSGLLTTFFIIQTKHPETGFLNERYMTDHINKTFREN